jgi:hypothetical protein
MEAIPPEWIDKLFNCMELFYGNRWTSKFKVPHSLEFDKAIWRSGLTGLTYDQIKNALVIYKRSAKVTHSFPPHVMEFFRMAKQ